jgi:23S rRNA pseudouridine2605 synthase
MRLQKALAAAGIASRRHAEQLIRAGRVTLNGVVITAMGVTVEARDLIQVDGRPIHATQAHTYVLLHKPRHVITTVSDPQGRPTILDFAPKGKRLFPVGRLDADSEGLILLTDDGELANRLMHPRYEHEKEYRVLVTGRPSASALKQLRTGVSLAEGVATAARVTIEQQNANDAWLRIVLREGRKRQIRRMLLAVGYPVKRLIRVRLGALTLGHLPVGQWRALTSREIAALKREA